MSCRYLRLVGSICAVFAITVASQARTVRIATFNIENGPDPAGTADYQATKQVLARIDADIVAFQEILADGSRNRVSVWQQLGAELGYAHVAVGTSASGVHRLGYYSRFPIVQSADVGSAWPASEFARRPMRVVVAVPGAAKPLVVWNMHHKADEPGFPDTGVGNRNNQLRRAIETLRIVQDINAYRAANPSHDEFVMLGDLNDDMSQSASQALQFTQGDYVSFKADTGLLPSTFVVGSDVQFPVPYRVFPDDCYAPAGGGLQRLDLRQQGGASRATRASRTLDYILVSAAIRTNAAGAPQGEVYNSQLDTLSNPGLPKAGQPLPAATSLDASDHLAVFADIQMADAASSPFITSFSPDAAVPGQSVTIEGEMLGSIASVRFGGVSASFQVESNARLVAVVPQGALSGPISVSGVGGTASSFTDFHVAALPSKASAALEPVRLSGFGSIVGVASSAQLLTVSGIALPGPLQVLAPPGFEVSLDGSSYSPSAQLPAPARSDASANYVGPWTNGSTAGSGFGAWSLATNAGSGTVSSYFAAPAESGVSGMGSRAFALRAEPADSGARIDAARDLQYPLAVGESLYFDWGINWDAKTASGGKGFAVKSGSATLLSVEQGDFPGPIKIRVGADEIDAGVAYGVLPMRWTFRQVDEQTLRVTATARTNTATEVYATNVHVPGAVSGFVWSANQMDADPKRRSYYDNLGIAAAAPGGGVLANSNVLVRMAARTGAGEVDGILQISSGGQMLAATPLSGLVSPLPSPNPSPSPDTGQPSLRVTVPRRDVVRTQAKQFALEGTVADNSGAPRVEFRTKAPSRAYSGWLPVKMAPGNTPIKDWRFVVSLHRKGEWLVQVRALDDLNNYSAVKTVTIKSR